MSGSGGAGFDYIELENGETRRLTPEEQLDGTKVPSRARLFSRNPLFSQKSGPNESIELDGQFYPSGGSSWKVNTKYTAGWLF